MMAIPPDLARLYESLLARKGVAVKERPYFHKWLRSLGFLPEIRPGASG
jgi:hypothetical protein